MRLMQQMTRSVLVLPLLLELTWSQSPNCARTQRPPTKPRYLKFCQDYNAEACCIPGHDLEAQAQFEFLIDGLGDGCTSPRIYPDIRYFYCLGCDPTQPQYTDQTASASPVVSICQSFVDELWSSSVFDECGVMMPNDCPAGFETFGPYSCGEGVIIPGNIFTGDSAGIDFLNTFKPPGLSDHVFVAINDRLGASAITLIRLPLHLTPLFRPPSRRDPHPGTRTV